MNAVGIDVSKGKNMVAIMRPFGEIVSTPFEIKHTTSDINSLVELINSVEGESRIFPPTTCHINFINPFFKAFFLQKIPCFINFTIKAHFQKVLHPLFLTLFFTLQMCRFLIL